MNGVNLGNFDARQVEPQQSLEAIPDGWYNVKIVGSEMKPTKNGNGAYLQFDEEILDGQYAGRHIFDRMNLDNPNPVAVEIGYRRLSAYCHATNVMQVQNSTQLHGIPFRVRVKLRVDEKGQYDPSNEVRDVKPYEGGAPAMAPAPMAAPPAQQPGWGQAPPAQPQQAAPAPAAAPAPPWARK